VSATATFVTALAIDLKKAQFLNSPDVSNWPVTGTLTLVEQDGGGEGLMCMAFTDPGWPDSPFFGDPTFGVFANQWYFAKINGIWHGGAGEWPYRGVGSCKAGQGTWTIGPDSFRPLFSTWCRESENWSFHGDVGRTSSVAAPWTSAPTSSCKDGAIPAGSTLTPIVGRDAARAHRRRLR
jgi:hypothetical protein